jgi:hypothetical protein
LDEHGAVVAAGRLDPRCYAFIDQKLLNFELEFALGAELRNAVFLARLSCGNGLRGKVSQFSIGVAVSLRIEALGTLWNGSGEDEFAFELIFIFGEVLFFGDRSEDGVGSDRTACAGSPRFRISD